MFTFIMHKFFLNTASLIYNFEIYTYLFIHHTHPIPPRSYIPYYVVLTSTKMHTTTTSTSILFCDSGLLLGNFVVGLLFFFCFLLCCLLRKFVFFLCWCGDEFVLRAHGCTDEITYVYNYYVYFNHYIMQSQESINWDILWSRILPIFFFFYDNNVSGLCI